MRKAFAILTVLVSLGALGCTRGLPGDEPPGPVDGKPVPNGATSNTAFFGPSQPTFTFISDTGMPSDAKTVDIINDSTGQ